MEKAWGGRFEGGTDPSVERFTASISIDRRLFRQDIAGSIAHARMLAAQGIISHVDAEAIVGGLETIHGEIEAGTFDFREDREDIHLNVEARLAELIGPAAGRLHTGRSRNDQIALDLRLWLMAAIDETIDRAARLIRTLLDQAESNRNVVLPGYTHLQRAQPVLFAHHLLAYVEMLRRDIGRLEDCRCRTDVMPLGSGALAGSPYPLDRERVAGSLGFAFVSRNSLDAVGDRDFVVEYLAAASLLMAHLSRFSEEIILWTSAEFGYLELSDGFSTGSSIMPQKKNPDIAELVRGKTGRVYGHLVALLTTIKGLPLAYNRDLQEDKPALFDAVDTVLGSLDVFAGMISTWTVQSDRMRAAADDDMLLATDYADYLVLKGMPFREAHGVVGRLVSKSLHLNRPLRAFSLGELQAESDLFSQDILATSPETSIAARNVPGGTAPARVTAAILEARKWLAELEGRKT